MKIEMSTHYTENFRYTQNQRRFECKFKVYKKIRQNMNKKGMYNNKTITELQTELSKFNHKTLNVDKFKEYLTMKNSINESLLEHYRRERFRKLRFYTYINKQKSESNMINNFKKKFGEPDKVIIGFGDWSNNNYHMKYHEPTKKGIGFRRLFRKAGYKVYLVHEYNTSCKCHNCQQEDNSKCETFKTCYNPRKWKKNELITKHGLLMCKTCQGLWNRDLNSSLNIHRLIEYAIQGKDRPKYLSKISTATTAPLLKMVFQEGMAEQEEAIIPIVKCINVQEELLHLG